MRFTPRHGLTAALLIVLLQTGCGSAPDIDPALQMPAYSDDPYAEVLDAAVVRGMVDYPAITGELDQRLDVYLDAVARFGPKSNPEAFPTSEERLAYYLNAYNAIMIRLWLNSGAREADPNDSVQWLTWFTVNQWKIDNRTMSLDYLEQRLIRPTFEEARVHAALVCGAVDCPPLRDEPYVGERLDEQLDDQMLQWLHDPSNDGLRITDDGRVYLSAIFGWYRDDFRPTGGLAAAIEQYLNDSDPRKAPALDAINNNKVKFMGYDWTINLPENQPTE